MIAYLIEDNELFNYQHILDLEYMEVIAFELEIFILNQIFKLK